jgi:probable FeS assembly SUF system protein SufT
METTREPVVLKRECEAVEIPSGKIITLFQGTNLTIMQALGGTFTVMTEIGQMASIAGKDADALGKEPPPEPSRVDSTGKEKSVEELVWDQLRTCYDPEIPHNIVDLGLVYRCDVNEAEKKADIRMTLTAPGCGMGDWLRQDVKRKVSTVPGISEVNVDVVFDPPWTRDKISPQLRRYLNL